jgi:hypothetical protein
MALSLEQNRDDRKNDRKDQRFQMDHASLTSHPRQPCMIGDRLRSGIHIAPTARRQADSCFIESLENPQCGYPQGPEQNETPAARRAEDEQHGAEERGGAERHEAQS